MFYWIRLLTPHSPDATFHVTVDSSRLQRPALHNRSQIVLTAVGQSHGWPCWQNGSFSCSKNDSRPHPRRPSIFHICLKPFRVTAGPELLPVYTGWEAGDMAVQLSTELTWRQTNTFLLIFTPYENFRFYLTHMFWDCGRKLKRPKVTHTETRTPCK